MPHDKQSSIDYSQNPENRVLRNFILLALPWLSFQREILAMMKKGIENASHVRPVENLTSRELQALMMIFDPSGKWRNLQDRDLEKKITDTYAEIFPKLVSGSFAFIEAQDAVRQRAGRLSRDQEPRGAGHERQREGASGARFVGSLAGGGRGRLLRLGRVRAVEDLDRVQHADR